MRDRDLPLVVGIGLILFSIVTGMGSISLGTYPVQSPIGVSYGSYLVTNYLIVLISVAIASAGIFLLYTAGKAAGSYIVEKGKPADRCDRSNYVSDRATKNQ